MSNDSEELKVEGWKRKGNNREARASVIGSLRTVQPRSE
jgi:hypothetical protein